MEKVFFFRPLPVFVDKIGKYSMFVVILQKLISSLTIHITVPTGGGFVDAGGRRS